MGVVERCLRGREFDIRHSNQGSSRHCVPPNFLVFHVFRFFRAAAFRLWNVEAIFSSLRSLAAHSRTFKESVIGIRR